MRGNSLDPDYCAELLIIPSVFCLRLPLRGLIPGGSIVPAGLRGPSESSQRAPGEAVPGADARSPRQLALTISPNTKSQCGRTGSSRCGNQRRREPVNHPRMFAPTVHFLPRL